VFRLNRLVVSALVVGATLVAPSLGAAATTNPPSCVPAQMSVSLGHASGAAGTIYYPLVFTNHGGECAIWGVPAIQPVGDARRPVGPRARNASIGEMPMRHVLAHGHVVSVGFGVSETGNYSRATCAPRLARGVVVSLAPFVKPAYVPLVISVCTRLASTSTRLLAPGTTGA
jgi:Domain of unknown function (DUF4232)